MEKAKGQSELGRGGINSFYRSGEIDCPGTAVPSHWDTGASTHYNTIELFFFINSSARF